MMVESEESFFGELTLTSTDATAVTIDPAMATTTITDEDSESCGVVYYFVVLFVHVFTWMDRPSSAIASVHAYTQHNYFLFAIRCNDWIQR